MVEKEKKVRRYEAEVMALPPLRIVLGEVPNPDPQRRRVASGTLQAGPDLEVTVLKLISRLKSEQ